METTLQIENISLGDINKHNVSLTLQKTNRLLSGNEKITVTELSGASAMIAVTVPMHNSIWINYDRIKNINGVKDVFDFFTVTKGLNYHELAHLLFTDFDDTNIKILINNRYPIQRLCQIINMLEDCRIENLFYALYPRVKNYFSYCAANLIIRETIKKSIKLNALVEGYILTYGRKFLNNYSKDIKLIRTKIVKEKFSNTDLYEIEQIIDAYIFEEDLRKRFNLAVELMKILDKNIKTKINSQLSSNTQTLSKEKKKRTRRDIEKVKEIISKLKKQLEKDSQSGSNSNKTNENETDDQDLVEKIKEDIQQQISIQDEIMNDIVSGIDSGLEDGFDIVKFNASNQERLEAKKIEDILKILRGGLTNKSIRFQKRGKLDIASVIKSQHNGSVRMFRKQQLNKISEAKMGVCIVLDTSGSIGDKEFEEEIKATWCLTQALERLDNKVEVIEFSNDYQIMKNFNDSGRWERSYRGGTSIQRPTEKAIDDLLKLKTKENISNLFIIIVSDGAFDEIDHYKREQTFINTCKNAKAKGIKMLWILADPNESKVCYSGFEGLQKLFNWTIVIKDLSQLSGKLKSIIKVIELEIINKVQRQGAYFN